MHFAIFHCHENNQIILIDVFLKEILCHIAQNGVATPEVFRKPGNTNEIKRIEKLLNEGKKLCIENYNFFTLASFIKVCTYFDTVKLNNQIALKANVVEIFARASGRNIWRQRKKATEKR